MNCSNTRRILSDRLEDITAGKIPAEAAAHLDACPQCASELQGMLKCRESLKLLAERPAPDGFTAAVMARLPAKRHKLQWLRIPMLRWAAVPATGVAILAVWIGSHTSVPPTPAVTEHQDHAYLQEYAQYRSQQTLGDQAEMLAIASESDDVSE